MPEYDSYIIEYISQHNDDIIPIILIVFSSLNTKDNNITVDAIIGNIEKMFSYVSNEININSGIVTRISIFLFLLSYFSKKYIVIIIKT